ncbi:MAG: Hint domain-containing protein, partial [Pseudomonadota bacterium]
AAGAVSENLPVPTGPNAATYSLQFNKPDPDTLAYETVDPGDAGAICFAAGTQIATPHGSRAVETLTPGDVVLTTDAGAEAIVWTGRQRVTGTGPLAPVEFAPGAIGNVARLRLSPQHRVLRQGPAVQLLFARPEILVPAHRLVGLPGVTRSPSADVTYVHFLLARHRLVWAEGAACESFYPGDVAMGTLSDRARHDLLARLPDPAAGLGAFGPTARPVEDGRSTRALVLAG